MPLRRTAALFAVALATTGAALQAAPETKLLMTERGKLLFSDDLNQPPGKEWIGKPGQWEIVDGALQGAERAADMHGAVRRHPIDFRDAVIQYDFRLLGARQSSLSLNSAAGHVARVLLRPNGFTVQRDAQKGGEKARVLETRSVALEPGRWYTLTLELLGDEMVAQVDGRVAFGADPLVAGPKTNFGFTVSGQAAQFRNLRVWAAGPNPTWAGTKKRLLAERKP
jgi:hypothetical protein